MVAKISWIGDDSGSILLGIVALVWDMAWGIAAAMKRHNFVFVRFFGKYLVKDTTAIVQTVLRTQTIKDVKTVEVNRLTPWQKGMISN